MSITIVIFKIKVTLKVSRIKKIKKVKYFKRWS